MIVIKNYNIMIKVKIHVYNLVNFTGLILIIQERIIITVHKVYLVILHKMVKNINF